MKPAAVRVLTGLLYLAAVATAVVEALNWWYADEQGFTLGVRTGWALLRSLGFLILVWHVRRGRAGAKPFGLILAVTTVFAVGRLLVPRNGFPPLPGILAFAALALLCATIVGLLYRWPSIQEYLVRHPNRLVAGRKGITWQEAAPRRPQVTGWLLTARVASFTYAPLMLVPCLVSIGEAFDGRLYALPVIVVWFLVAIGVSYAVLFASIFLLRGQWWARWLMVGITLGVLVFDLPLCWWLLGADGLIRDGGPLVVAAGLALYGMGRAR
jgi:hypothetical protein